jgi:hypothetical protein
MTTEEFIIHLFCLIDDQMSDVAKHPQAKLYPSELVTIGVLFALRGGMFRVFYRWLVRDYGALFGEVPERTRLQRALHTHQDWCERFLKLPTFFTIIDSYGVELIQPVREGRSKRQVGKKGYSNRRWIVGMKLCCLVNAHGEVVDWDSNTANFHDQHFRPLAHQFDEQTITLSDLAFRKAGDLQRNIKPCLHKTWSERMLIESLFSFLTRYCYLKHLFHRVRAYVESHFAYVAALVNLLLQLKRQLFPHLPADRPLLGLAQFAL